MLLTRKSEGTGPSRQSARARRIRARREDRRPPHVPQGHRPRRRRRGVRRQLPLNFDRRGQRPGEEDRQHGGASARCARTARSAAPSTRS